MARTTVSSQCVIVSKYAKMWPREVFDIKSGNKLLEELRGLLSSPGVYVLYGDDQPYYVGKTAKAAFQRIWQHANRAKDRYYNFWNFFSAFAVNQKACIDEIEGILIAAMPTDNRAVRRIEKIYLPKKVARLIRDQRIIQASNEQR
jgi:hypothetical protein